MKTLTIFVLIPFFAISSQVFCQPAPFNLPGARLNGVDGNHKCLELTHEQVKKMTALQKRYEKEVTPLRIMEFERKSELRLLWMEVKPDPEQVKSRHREILDIDWRIQVKTIEYWMKFRGILTPEQLSHFLVNSGGHDFRPPRTGGSSLNLKIFPHKQPRKGF